MMTTPRTSADRPDDEYEAGNGALAQATAAFGLGVVVAFALVVVLLPFIKADFDPVSDAISHGAVGELGWLQSAAFVALGAGSLAIAWALGRAIPGRGGRTGAALVAGWGVCIVLAGLFTADTAVPPETTAGKIHSAASILAFGVVLAGMTVLSFAFRKAPGWRDRFAMSIALAVVGFVGLVATVATRSTEFWGAVQRPFVAVLIVWLGWVSVILMRRPNAPTVETANPATQEA